MKTKTYSYALVALALAVTAASCDENAWNDKLNGFEEANDEPFAVQKTVEYTLSDAEYATIASNATNVALAGTEGAAALKAVGTQKYFTADAPASKYVPAFLGSSNFPYFVLTKGSSVKLTYNQETEADATLTEANTQNQTVQVPDEFYQNDVWKSDENFVNCFAPSKPAANYLPEFLKSEADGGDGTYAIVTYMESAQEPVFGAADANTPVEVELMKALGEELAEMPSDWTIDNAVMPSDLSFVWSWKVYNSAGYLNASAYLGGTSYTTTAYAISPEIDLTNATEASLNFDHAAKFQTTLKSLCGVVAREIGTTAWTNLSVPTWPEAGSWTFANSGAVSLEKFLGKKIQIAFKYGSSADGADTWEIKNLTVNATVVNKKAPASRAAQVPMVQKNAIYYFDGNNWTVPAGFVILQPSDYSAMGQRYANLSKAEPYLSTYLAQQFPYAAEGDTKYVMWNHYANSTSTYECSKYEYNGSEWTEAKNYAPVTEQFVYGPNGWMYDPNVTITLPAGRNQELSMKYFQACVDWVFNNICKPLGDTDIKSGKFYVTSFGNNEYYAGTSAYQGNLDLRPEKAREQYPAGYEGMTDDEIVALEKKRFMEEVMPGALAALHPDAAPIEGLEVLYTINFAVYNGSTSNYTAVFKVAGKGQFEPVSCTWDE